MRGTTPTIEFDLPFVYEELEVLYITFNQNGKTVLEKTLDDCKCVEKTWTCNLTQEDTLKLLDRYDVEIQLRGKNKAGVAFKSDIEKHDVERILKDGVI